MPNPFEHTNRIGKSWPNASHRLANRSIWTRLNVIIRFMILCICLFLTLANNPVKMAIKTSANRLHQIGGQHEEHGKKDLEQLLDFLFIIKGVSASTPDTVNTLKVFHHFNYTDCSIEESRGK